MCVLAHLIKQQSPNRTFSDSLSCCGDCGVGSTEHDKAAPGPIMIIRLGGARQNSRAISGSRHGKKKGDEVLVEVE
jgi:hypothetical protein